MTSISMYPECKITRIVIRRSERIRKMRQFGNSCRHANDNHVKTSSHQKSRPVSPKKTNATAMYKTLRDLYRTQLSALISHNKNRLKSSSEANGSRSQRIHKITERKTAMMDMKRYYTPSGSSRRVKRKKSSFNFTIEGGISSKTLKIIKPRGGHIIFQL